MANESVSGEYMILRKIPFQESSLIVAGISPEYGRLDFLLKGARSIRKRQFPEAELFREFRVIFREAKNTNGLSTMISCDPICRHDAIAAKPEHYLAACSCAAYFLRHTKPMLAIPDSYRALSHLLTRLEGSSETEPWISLAKFVFLYENGFVPLDGGSTQETGTSSIQRLLSLAMMDSCDLPPDKNGFWSRFRVWIDNLSAWHGLEK